MYLSILIKLSHSITNSRIAEKVMPYRIPPNGFAGGGFRLMLPSGGISPLTCTIFDLAYFGGILRSHVFHIFPTRLKKSIMGKLLNFGLKIAHRLSQG